MKYLVNRAQMRACDEYTSAHFGVPSVVLMERAALAVADCVEAFLDGKINSRILVLCGFHNNGADGMAAARLLRERGFAVTICLTGKDDRQSELNKLQLSICRRYGIAEIIAGAAGKPDMFEYDMIVDAILGIGCNRAPEPETAELIEKVNASGVPVIAVDVPSGIDIDSGKIPGAAIRAQMTVTFGFLKAGMYRYPVKAFCGKIRLAQIGITEESLTGTLPQICLTEEADIRAWWPMRPENGNKGTFGKILLYAGQKNMAGACILAAKSCYRTGAGMVRILTVEENRELIQTAVPEALLTTLSDADTIELREQKIKEAVSWADLAAAGPGIGTDKEAAQTLKLFLRALDKKPLILDADALNLLSEDSELQVFLRERAPFSTVVTPHPGELARLTGKAVGELKDQAPAAEWTWVEDYGCILTAKDAVTHIYTPQGNCYVCDSGHSGMATAGSGDVLTGMMAALLAVIKEPEKAAVAAVFLHGCAGRIAAEQLTGEAVMASDIIDRIPDAIFRIRNAG